MSPAEEGIAAFSGSPAPNLVVPDRRSDSDPRRRGFRPRHCERVRQGLWVDSARGIPSGERGKRGGGRDGRKRLPNVRRVSLFFKKRKTGKNCSGKRDFSCSTDGPSFGWGLGIGVIYTMSTAKEEISELSDAVDETAKVVLELKTKLCRRRSHHTRLSSSDRCIQAMGQGNIALRGSSGAEDGECASSILTEELLPEGTEMDSLEAEFESELLKLPSFVDQASDEPRVTRDYSEPPGVSPVVLSEKLSDVLIKQLENHISELESELKLAYS